MTQPSFERSRYQPGQRVEITALGRADLPMPGPRLIGKQGTVVDDQSAPIGDYTVFVRLDGDDGDVRVFRDDELRLV